MVSCVFFFLEKLPTYNSTNSKVLQNIVIGTSTSDVLLTVVQSNNVNNIHPWYCHPGLPAIVRLSPDLYNIRCFCPSNSYGDHCQYQSQHVIVTLKVYPAKRRGIQSFLITLVSDDDHRDVEIIHSHHQANYVLDDSCSKTFKFSLLYSTRPKNLSSHYFIKIDAFNQSALTYLASWRYRIPFTFLPVNPMTIIIRVPVGPVSSPSRCRLTCGHGQCMKYVNEDYFFCRCHLGWTGKRCDHPINCNDCALDSLCVGSHENRSICICPVNTFGRRCLLKYSYPENFCENGGQSFLTDQNNKSESHACLCQEQFYGTLCHNRKNILVLSFKDMIIPSHILVNVFYTFLYALSDQNPSLAMYAQKLHMFQRSVTLYINNPLQIIIVQANEKYYLSFLHPTTEIKYVSSTISPAQQCPLFQEIARPHLINLSEIRRVKYYHQLCQLHSHLMCFIDTSYLCLCTLERHANCLRFEQNFTCSDNIYCQNGAQCFQDQSNCPRTTFCVCSDCYYGDRCQFYAKGIGLTLDDMFRYELQPSINFHQQPISVKVSAALAVIMFVAGLINSILSLMTFHSSASRQVGAGMYLFASAVTSLLTVRCIQC